MREQCPAKSGAGLRNHVILNVQQYRLHVLASSSPSAIMAIRLGAADHSYQQNIRPTGPAEIRDYTEPPNSPYLAWPMPAGAASPLLAGSGNPKFKMNRILEGKLLHRRARNRHAMPIPVCLSEVYSCKRETKGEFQCRICITRLALPPSFCARAFHGKPPCNQCHFRHCARRNAGEHAFSSSKLPATCRQKTDRISSLHNAASLQPGLIP